MTATTVALFSPRVERTDRLTSRGGRVHTCAGGRLAAAAGKAGGSRADMRHVLVVDDMIETCRLVAALLSRCGHRATWATSGKEALAALARDPADLVLLDAMMPDMDGAEVLR